MADASDHDGTDGVVLADVGGTNVRFAVLTGGTLGAIDAYRGARPSRRSPTRLPPSWRGKRTAPRSVSAILAVAGVVEGERCALTNNPWVVDAAELRARFGFAGIRLVNDFEAIAWSLPHLAADDLRKIGGGEPVAQAPMVVLGPGTGLGVAAYVPHAQGGSRPAQRRRSCHAAERLVARGRHHRESATALRARLRRTRVVRAGAGKSLPRHRVDRRADGAGTHCGRDHAGRDGRTLRGQSRRARHFLRDAWRRRRQFRAQLRRARRGIHRRRDRRLACAIISPGRNSGPASRRKGGCGAMWRRSRFT